MKKFLAFMLTLAMILSLAACGGTKSNDSSASSSTNDSSSGSAQVETQTVKLALVVNEGTPLAIACQKFADDVYEKTNGQIKVDLYAGGTLGTETELKEAISLGTVEMVNLGWSLLSNKFSYSMSYIGYYELADRATMNDFFSGDEAQRLYDAYEAMTGVRVISTNWQQGTRHTIASRPFSNLNELKGLKIRTPAGVTLDLDAWSSWGTLPTGMALSEVYSGIEQGVIEAVECPLDYLWTYGFHEAGAKNLMLTGHQLYNNLLAVNTDWFDSLSPEIQQIIIDCANECGDYQTELVLDLEEEYLQNFKDAGVNVVEISDDVKAEMKALVAPINAEQKALCDKELKDMGY